ncbi:MAG: hypothetical protein IJ419_10050 [Agathobacter sp.]|nr:hypothetical protein [Agathobacter sp.]
MRTVIFAYELYNERYEALPRYDKQQSLNFMRSYKRTSDILCDEIDRSLS